MTKSNNLGYFILFFYRTSMIVCLKVVSKYEIILVIFVIILINIKFVVKYQFNGLAAA
jgi:hypothetical protein